MKTYINRQSVFGPWGGGAQFVNNFRRNVKTRTNDQLVEVNQLNVAPDVILAVGLDAEGPDAGIDQLIQYKSFMQGRKDVKLVLRVNENDARKNTRNVDAQLLRVANHIDGTIFVSDWLKSYFLQQGWPDKNTTVIINGVDEKVFKPNRTEPSEKVRIVAHHWSDNEHKGFDFYEKLDEFVGKNPDFQFTYVGRHRGTFKNTNLIRPVAGKVLGEEVGKHDVYVSASRWEPGANHVLEALSCELPTYVHKDGGSCVEFAGKDHVFNDWPELETLLRNRSFVKNSTGVRLQSWDSCIEQYVAFLEATWNNK